MGSEVFRGLKSELVRRREREEKRKREGKDRSGSRKSRGKTINK